MAKYIFVTGGVLSSLGKGIAASAIGALLEARGLKVTIQKLDPYINVDPGTLSPFQHGEVFVTDDGAGPIWTWAIMKDLPLRACPRRTIIQPVKFTTMSS